MSTWWQIDGGFSGHLALSSGAVIGTLLNDIIAVTGPDAGGSSQEGQGKTPARGWGGRAETGKATQRGGKEEGAVPGATGK